MLNRLIFLGIVVFFFFGCDAPRNNPLDPRNPNRKLVALRGQVLTFSLPHIPLKQAEVTFNPAGQLQLTDVNGAFEFNNIPPFAGWLHVNREGFHPDSVRVSWISGGPQTLEIYLNARPRLDSLIFYSSLINRYPAIQIIDLSLKADIVDQDNDIDSVFLNNAYFHYSTLLTFNASSKYFEKSHISLADLQASSGEEIIGRPFQLLVKDRFGHAQNLKAIQILRIIRDEVELKSPAGHDTVSVSPVLRWVPVTPGYPFTYLVEVRTNEADPQLVWQKANIAADASSIQVDIQLPLTPINSYIWAVWIIDNFGNRARSKYKTFLVE